MKKILATILALTMIVGMSLTAFAADFANNETITAINGAQDVEVTATYKTQSATNNPAPVYSVNISWDDISFEYTAASDIYKWNPATLAYDIKDGENSGTWATKTAIIYLENRSNAGVVVTPTWEAEDGIEVTPVISALNVGVTLETAVGKTGTGTTGQITVSKPTSGSIAKAGKLGTITLTITAAPVLE